MTAHALETSASVASLGALYERKSRFRVTPRFVFAVGVVAAAQVALGVYMAHVVFELPVEPWDEPTPINVGIQKIPVETPKRPPPPPKSEQPKPRQPALPVPTDGPTIPIPPVPPMPPPEPLVQGPPAPPAPPPPPPRQPTIANPKWLQRPTADQLARLYPSRAQRMDKTGQATLNCVVTPDGLMDKCQIASETPPDFGFGEAALRAARYFKISPPMSDGKPVEGAQIRIPIKFSLE